MILIESFTLAEIPLTRELPILRHVVSASTFRTVSLPASTGAVCRHMAERAVRAALTRSRKILEPASNQQ